ncbi:hypothetical protein C0214_13695 [Methylobacterium sp. DM1]|nr:hypothetical protein C0214_13695 [Methylobacterium sp. DM1]
MNQPMPIAANDGRQKTYPSLGKCIYCGADKKLSREHIIPFGLGGNLVFTGASCEQCAKATSDFERYCLRNMFQAARTHLKLPTRNKKEKPKTLRLSYFRHEGTHEWLDVPVSDHPYAVVLPIFQPPTFISGSPHQEGLVLEGTAILSGPGFFEKLQKFGSNKAFTQELSPDLFGRMLAKIAHGFAIAELGNNAFMPLLQGLIRGTEPFSSACIGGGKELARQGPLHQLSLDWRDSLLVCSIVLFSMEAPEAASAPTYEVIVGART